MNRSSEEPLLLTVWTALLQDANLTFPHLKREFARDIKTITRRVTHEGIGILTKLLPSFGEAFLRHVDADFSQPIQYPDGWPPKLFRWIHKSLTSGDAIATVRLVLQLCFIGNKFGGMCSESARKHCIAEFVSGSFASNDVDESTIAKAKTILSSILRGYRPRKPSYGPGAIRDGLGPLKCDSFHLNFRSEHRFPIKEWAFGSDGQLYTGIQSRNRYVSRLHSVPKNARKPRLIAIEDSQAAFLQQAIMRSMYQCLYRVGQDLRDQSRMHQLIRSGDYATIDLSAASDTVSTELVKSIFPEHVVSDLMSVRSDYIDVEGYRLYPMFFSTMGNATTFPVLTLTLFSLLRSIEHDVHVYGDDIIVPKAAFTFVAERLEEWGFKVNRDKSFAGSIQESCGLFLYKGEDVTPIYLRTDKDDPTSLASINACANALSKLWFKEAAEILYRYLERKVGLLPEVSGFDVGFLCRYYGNLTDSRVEHHTVKHHSHYHGKLVKAWHVTTKETAISRVCEHRRYADFLSSGQPPAPVRRRTAVIRKRWFVLT